MKPDIQSLIAEHTAWVNAWSETSLLAASGYPDHLTAEQRDAYASLPDLIEQCRAAWCEIPATLQPIHYLSTSVYVQP